ncbi:MAG: hypothetical protein CMC93_05505 [Flavobacteriaceae bacterium]|nr:hypothetical protein [Flavobacteriaceae bacterium]|tara:strand:+ start:5815 stop:6525 length:711 start_codon:yes stop_codon:yes gene_type:complete
MYNKMSTFPKLNIDISDLRPKKFKFVDIEPEPPPQTTTIQISRRSIFLITCGIIIVSLFVVSLFVTPQNLRPRRIMRMQCYTDASIQTCTTPLHNGEFVISNCDAYEFNGIPSIDFLKVNGNFRIPLSNDLTLRIKDPCPNIIATVDTQKLTSYYREFTRVGLPYTKRLVWLTDICYSSFTVIIGSEKIFDSTPSSMIDHVDLVNKTAYTYESPGVSGRIQITGQGCTKPIHIYSL